MTEAQETLQLIRLCVQDTQAPVENMYFQPEASIYTYGALPTAVLSKTCSRVYQLKYEPTEALEKHNGHYASLLAKGVR